MKSGDIIVAGRNFGCGSLREHAPLAIKECGVSCVIAASFARIFYRNALNIALPIVRMRERKTMKKKIVVFPGDGIGPEITAEAACVEQAVDAVLSRGMRTCDIVRAGECAVSTVEIGDAVVRAVREGV